MASPQSPADNRKLRHQRWRLLVRLNRVLDWPMTALAFVWLGLLILDFTTGLSPWMLWLNHAIWALFALQFLLEIWLAPSKMQYMRRNWLVALSLLLPAFRVLRVLKAFRVFGVARAARPVGLLRLVTSLNRGMAATRAVLRRHGIEYVVALTIIVIFSGAAGMYFFENPRALAREGYSNVVARGGGLRSYGEAVWWTAMIVTTMGSEYWPKTAEGRLLCWMLAVYAFAIFGYITATIASFFIGEKPKTPPPEANEPGVAEVEGLRAEIAALRAEIARLSKGREGK